MTNVADQPGKGDLLRRALMAIDDLQRKLDQLESARHEPIAVVGIGCRFPGAEDQDELWRNLMEGVDAVTEVPSSRWDVFEYFDPDPNAPGKSYTKWGGFIDNVDMFDAAFFGITPREATALDPQQRLLLEMAWLALEDANIAPTSVADTRMGVYVGICCNDYMEIIRRSVGAGAEAYALSGTAHSMAGGRVSYFLGAQGPNVSIDTACSSSLVAIHLAVKALREGECDSALAGGINVSLEPTPTVMTSRARMMSPTGRCHAFDAAADGYVRSEGVGLIVLKRLSDAQRDGDRILSLIRGVAINQDGRSSGLTAPHGPSQEAVIRAALENGGVTADDIAFVEAHGTGTALGDPIEVNALGKVFASRQRSRPVLLGSVKASIGHAETAAGVAGLIKATMALRHRQLPAQLHLHTPNPMIAWDELALAPLIEPAKLKPASNGPLMCGVSSFGFSGTNAHAILEEAPTTEVSAPEPHAADASTLLVFSARNSEALKELAGRFADTLEGEDAPSLRALAAAAPTARAQFAERAGVIAADAAEACAALRQMAQGIPSPAAVRGRMSGHAHPEVVFLFTGQGSQYAGMGAALYKVEPAFRLAMDECERLARPLLGRSLLDIILGRADDPDLVDDTTYTQPALFCIEYALAQTWRAWGVTPAAVMGHSIGELTAACVAGMLSLKDAIRLVVARGRLMGSLPKGGAMAAVFAPERVVRAVIAQEGDKLSIAAVNGPTNIVVSGEEDALERVLRSLQGKGVELQRLNVSHAFHSAQMDSILDEFEAVAGTLRFSPPDITVMSNVSGGVLGPEGLRPDYWRRHIREAVRFSDGVSALESDGHRIFLEMGPAPILAGLSKRCSTADDAKHIASLRRGRDDRRVMLEAAAQLFTAGVQMNWAAILGARVGHVDLPHYPFQRTRYWIEAEGAARAAAFAGDAVGHPLLGVKAAAPIDIFQTRLGLARQPWTRDHRVFGFAVFPATGFFEMALAAARKCAGENACLEGITISEALMLPDRGEVETQVVLPPAEGGKRTVQIYSRASGDSEGAAEWRLHMSAAIGVMGAPTAAPLRDDHPSLRSIETESWYGRVAGLGAEFGPLFRGMKDARREGSQLFSDVLPPIELQYEQFIIHPALLDASLHAGGIGMETEEDEGTSKDVFLPVGAKRYAAYKAGATAATARVMVRRERPDSQTADWDITLFDGDGEIIAEVDGLEVRRGTREALARLAARLQPKSQWRFDLEWREASAVAPTDLTGRTWLLFADAGGVAPTLAARLSQAGAKIVQIPQPASRDPAAVEAVIAATVAGQPGVDGAIYLWALDAPPNLDKLEQVTAAVTEQYGAALNALRALAEKTSRILVATRGSQPVIHRTSNLAQSSVWALAGVVLSEYPACGLGRVDLDPAGSGDADALFAEACATDREDSVAYRYDRRYLARLAIDKPTHVEDNPVSLEIPERGSLGNLRFMPMQRSGPAAGQVEIRVHATGLNFRDVLNALGAYPGDPGPLGNECSGVVTAVGDGVDMFNVGDDVVAMINHSFASYVVAPQAMCVRKPAYLSHQAAATVPITFLTADYALRSLSGLKPGDRVLIHAVTGGVGMAATQIALKAGATVYGTAGSPAKRALATSMGVHHVSDSRSLSFVEDFQRATKGEGVDIVLNSLAGDFIPASLSLVRDGGSFVEIGKTDIWDAASVAKAYPGVRYHALYLGDLSDSDPMRIQQMLSDIVADMRPGGSLHPLPQTTFDLVEAERAFRYMGQGMHTGKVVLTQRPGAPIRHDGTYIVTGGLTGLGLTTARWLARQGAGGIALCGRREPSAEALKAIAEMESAGAKVRAFRLDVADPVSLRAMLDEARSTFGPVRGVFHAAGVLDDGMLSEQTAERFAAVMAPKVRGGWALHDLTLADPVEHFVLYSSAAAVLSSPGQGNYAAANAFLDGLAHYRWARGLPSLSVNWGSWSDVGMAAGLGETHQRRWAAMGLKLITPDAGMDMLAEMLADGAGPQTIVIPMSTGRPSGQAPALFADLAGGAKSRVEDTEPAIDIMSELRACAEKEREKVFESYVSGQVRRALALPANYAVDVHESLLNLGMDSLMAMEVRNRLQSGVGIRVSISDLLEGASVAKLARKVLGQLTFQTSEPQAKETAEMEWEEGLV